MNLIKFQYYAEKLDGMARVNLKEVMKKKQQRVIFVFNIKEISFETEEKL